MPTHRSMSEAQTERIAAQFAKTLRGSEVLLLEGDLGAGKTAFTRGLAKGLGVRDRITSPTFVLMRVHELKNGERKDGAHDRSSPPSASPSVLRRFVHVDAYRVHHPRDLEAIGLLEYTGRPDAVVVIEWGERVAALLRSVPTIRILFAIAPKNGRIITITQRRVSARRQSSP